MHGHHDMTLATVMMFMMVEATPSLRQPTPFALLRTLMLLPCHCPKWINSSNLLEHLTKIRSYIEMLKDPR